MLKLLINLLLVRATRDYNFVVLSVNYLGISSLFLLLQGTLQKYIDDLFRTILSVNPVMPPVIKYLFDYLDDAAVKYGINDPDVLHTWKCNR